MHNSYNCSDTSSSFKSVIGGIMHMMTLRITQMAIYSDNNSMPHKYLLVLLALLLWAGHSRRLTTPQATPQTQPATTTAAKSTEPPTSKPEEKLAESAVSKTEPNKEEKDKKAESPTQSKEGEKKKVSWGQRFTKHMPFLHKKKSDQTATKSTKEAPKQDKSQDKDSDSKQSEEATKEEEEKEVKSEEAEQPKPQKAKSKWQRKKKTAEAEQTESTPAAKPAEEGNSWWVLTVAYLGIFGLLSYGFKRYYFPTHSWLEMMLDLMIIAESYVRRRRESYEAPKYTEDIDDADSIEVGYNEEQGRKLFWEKSSVEGI